MEVLRQGESLGSKDEDYAGLRTVPSLCLQSNEDSSKGGVRQGESLKNEWGEDYPNYHRPFAFPSHLCFPGDIT
jgi:hypothetical protein